jgi:acyl carrier protein
MQIDRATVLDSIYRAIDSLNQTLPADKRIDKAADTVLMGAGGSLDSLGLVNLVVETEMAIEEDFGKTVNLADQNAAVQGMQVFENVSTFARYIESLLNL